MLTAANVGRMLVGCGCVNLGSASSGRSINDHIRLVQEAVDSGVTLFDTADVYGSGSSERVLGRALAGRRDDVTIATKGGYVFRERSAAEQFSRRAIRRAYGLANWLRPRASEGQGADRSHQVRSSYASRDFSADHLRRAVTSSLRRLRTEYIDVYQLHGPPTPMPEVIAELEDLRRAGKVRRFGVGAESTESARAWSEVSDIDVIQLPFGVLDPFSLEIREEANSARTELWIRGVLGGGVLAAAMRDPSDIGQHPKHSLIVALMKLAADEGFELDELAVRWAIGASGAAAMLLGISSADHLARNLRHVKRGPLPNDLGAEVTSTARRLAVAP